MIWKKHSCRFLPDSCVIKHSSCIDKKLVESIIGCQINVGKDKNQRAECGCVESIDIGAYDSCQHGCVYCYANHGRDVVTGICRNHDSASPLLCGKMEEKDKITVRQMKSVKEGQLRLFDL